MSNGWKKGYLRYKDFFLTVSNAYNTKPSLKIYLELILTLTTIIIFLVFAIRPTIITIIDLTKEIGQKELVSKKLMQKVSDLKTVNGLLQEKIEEIKFVDQAIPKKPDPDTILRQLQTILNENSLTVLSYTSSETIITDNQEKTSSASGQQKELQFSLSVSGPYSNIILFIKSIENMRRPIAIDSFIINSSNNEADKNLVLTISGKVPYTIY